ncbi:MAG: MFS transporter [Mariniblastus sp.]|nr:MFS transporter [Mariniblastus sp.]
MQTPDPLNSPSLDEERSEREAVAPGRNFSLLALYQVVMRTGWIFKTESIIMPAVLDLMGGNAILRGCLPMLNRLGQSFPPLIAADYIRQLPHKKRLLALCAAVMGVCFISLALVWRLADHEQATALPYLFLLIYGIFFSFVGLHNLVMSLLVGKLIPVTQRGRLMLVSMTLGCLSAVAFAWLLLRNWLGQQTGQFESIFLFTGVAFLFSALVACCLKEVPDVGKRETKKLGQVLRQSWETLRVDRNFRVLVIIAALFGMSMTLFPHYQALARGRLEVGLQAMVPWLIVQNMGAAGFSIPMGWLADRYGFRLVLRIQMLLLMMPPIFAIWFANLTGGSHWFLLVFALLGLSPVMLRTFSNYTLEIADRQRQPIYLSTMSVCMAVPVLATSLLVGLMVELIGFEITFLAVIVAIFIGWILTFRLGEPRHQAPGSMPTIASSTEKKSDPASNLPDLS